MKNKGALLTKNQLSKLRDQSIRSIKYFSSDSGDTLIKIETDDFLIKLGANDLGAWTKQIVRKNLPLTK